MPDGELRMNTGEYPSSQSEQLREARCQEYPQPKSEMPIKQLTEEELFEARLFDMLEYGVRDYKISIRKLDVGYIVELGCKSLAFTDENVMLEEISQYLKDPKSVLIKYKNLWFKK